MMDRKQGEVIRIGDQISIEIVRMKFGKVRLAIEAPKDLKIITEHDDLPGAVNDRLGVGNRWSV